MRPTSVKAPCIITDEQIGILYQTENWEEYKSIYRLLPDLEDTYYWLTYNECLKEYQPVGRVISFPAGTELFHISHVKNIKELKSSFRSRDERLYSENRIYMTTDTQHIWDRSGSVYRYICNGTESFKVDTEFNGDYCVYLYGDNPFSVPVTEV